MTIPGRTALLIGAALQCRRGLAACLETGDSSGNQAILFRTKQDSAGSLTSGMTGVLRGDGVPERGDAKEPSQGPQATADPGRWSALALSPGQAVELNGLQYTFTGQREFSGLTVRRAPAALHSLAGLLGGLAFCFYTPRRRLWGRGPGTFSGRRSAIEKELSMAARASELATTRSDSMTEL